MASIKIANKNFMSQSGNDEPAITSNVTFPAGHVIQWVNATGNEDPISGQKSSYVTTNVTGSITPKFTSSKIYVHAVFSYGLFATNSSGQALYSNIYRSGSSVTDEYIDQDGFDMYFEAGQRTSTTNAQCVSRNPIDWYDTPGHSNITDAITYTVYIKGGTGTGGFVQIHKDHGKWQMQLVEIAQ